MEKQILGIWASGWGGGRGGGGIEKNVLCRELEREICPRSVLDCGSWNKSTVNFETHLYLVAWWF